MLRFIAHERFALITYIFAHIALNGIRLFSGDATVVIHRLA